jgi:hypothetical protein
MKKTEWVRPRAVVQVFVPNEYVAACVVDFDKTECDHTGGFAYNDFDENGKFDLGVDTYVFDFKSLYHESISGYDPNGDQGFAMWHNGNYTQNYTTDTPVYYWQDAIGTYHYVDKINTKVNGS